MMPVPAKNCPHPDDPASPTYARWRPWTPDPAELRARAGVTLAVQGDRRLLLVEGHVMASGQADAPEFLLLYVYAAMIFRNTRTLFGLAGEA